MTRPNLHLRFFLTVFFGVMLTYVVFNPGLADTEMKWIREQAELGKFNDWHAIGMTMLWYVTEPILGGSPGILIAHLLVFWSGVAALGVAAGVSSAWILIPSLMLSPFVFPILGFVMKDMTVVAFLMLGYGFLAMAMKVPDLSTRSRSTFLAIAFFAGFYATLSRYNALPACIPLFWLIGLPWSDRSQPKFLLGNWRSLQLLIAQTVLVLVGIAGLNEALVSVRSYPSQQVMLFDLVGISVRCNKYVLPDFYAPDKMTLEDVRKIYNPKDVGPIFWGAAGVKRPHFVFNPSESKKLASHWIKTIFNYPLCYSSHRLSLFLATTGYFTDVYWIYPDPNSPYFETNIAPHPQLAIMYFKAFEGLFGKYIFRPGSALLILIALSTLCYRRREHFGFAFCASGVLFSVSQVICGLAEHSRYNYWTIVASTTAVALSFAFNWYRGERPPVRIQISPMRLGHHQASMAHPAAQHDHPPLQHDHPQLQHDHPPLQHDNPTQVHD